MQIVRELTVARKRGCFILFTLVLLPRCHTASYVPLCFVEFKEFLDLKIQRPVGIIKPLSKVLVYGGFADTETFGGFAYSCFVLDDEVAQITSPLIYVFTHKTPLPAFFTMLIYIRQKWYL